MDTARTDLHAINHRATTTASTMTQYHPRRSERTTLTPWGVEQGIATPDAGSTLSLMTLTLMALGLVARRFQRAAG